LVFLKKLSQKDLKRAFDSDAFFGLFLMLVGGYYFLQAWGMVNGDKVLPARAWAILVSLLVGLVGTFLLGLYFIGSWYLGEGDND